LHTTAILKNINTFCTPTEKINVLMDQGVMILLQATMIGQAAA
jgi:hypothetical protein